MKFVSHLFLILFAATVVAGCNKGGGSSEPSTFQGLWSMPRAAESEGFAVLSIGVSGHVTAIYGDVRDSVTIKEIDYGDILSDGNFVYSLYYRQETEKAGGGDLPSVTFKKTSADTIEGEFSRQGDKAPFSLKKISSVEYSQLKEEFLKKGARYEALYKSLIGTKWELVSKTAISKVKGKEYSIVTLAKDLPDVADITVNGKPQKAPVAKRISFTDNKNVLVNGSVSEEYYFKNGLFLMRRNIKDSEMIDPTGSKLELKGNELVLSETFIDSNYQLVYIYKRMN